jgi:Flavin-binding monooxygenase-like
MSKSLNDAEMSAEYGTHISLYSNGRLYNNEVGQVPSIPSESPFTIEPPLPGTPPTYVSPAYTMLWANTPRDIMTYSDQLFPEGTPAFPFRTQVHEYLRTYADEIRPLIRFRKEVVRVEKRGDNWVLHITDLTDHHRKVSIKEFDAVAVATGIFSR